MNFGRDKDSTPAKMRGAAASSEDENVLGKGVPSSKHGETGKEVILLDGWFLEASESLTRWFRKVFHGEGGPSKGAEEVSIPVKGTARSANLYSGVPFHDNPGEHYREAKKKSDHTEPESILYDALFLPPLRALAPWSWKQLHWPKRFRLRIKPPLGGGMPTGICQPGHGQQSEKASGKGTTVLTVPVRAGTSSVNWTAIGAVLALGLVFQ